MIEKLKIFENEEFMKACAIIAFFGGFLVASLTFSAFGRPDAQVPFYIVQGLLAIFLYRSYREHEKNVMKGLLGALLCELLLSEFCYIFGAFSERLASMFSAGFGEGFMFIIIESIIIGMQILMFINHFAINSDHHSSPGKIKLNQYLLLGVMLVLLLQKIVFALVIGISDTARVIWQASWFVFEICTYALIICIESRLDFFRIIREGGKA